MTNFERLALEKTVLLEGILALRQQCNLTKFYGNSDRQLDKISLRIEEILLEFNKVC